MPWAAQPDRWACRARLHQAAPVSSEWLQDGTSFSAPRGSTVAFDTRMISAEAFLAHNRLDSVSNPNNFGQCSVSRRA